MKKLLLLSIVLLFTGCVSTVQSKLQSNGWIPLGDFQRTGFIDNNNGHVPKESLLGMTCDKLSSLNPRKPKHIKFTEYSWIMTDPLPTNQVMKDLDNELKLSYLRNNTDLKFTETEIKNVKIDPKNLAKLLIDNNIIIPVGGVTVDRIAAALPSLENKINYTTTINENSTRIVDQKNIINILSNIADQREEMPMVDSVFIADLNIAVTIENNIAFPADIVRSVKTGTKTISGKRIILGYKLVTNKHVLNESVKDIDLKINELQTLSEPSLKFVFNGNKINFICSGGAFDLYDKSRHKKIDINDRITFRNNLSLYVSNQKTVYHLDFKKKDKSYSFSKNIYTIDRKDISINDITKSKKD